MPKLECFSLLSGSTVTSREIFYSMTVDWAMPLIAIKPIFTSNPLHQSTYNPLLLFFRNCLKVALDCNFDHVITAAGNKWSSVGGQTKAQDISVFGRFIDG